MEWVATVSVFLTVGFPLHFIAGSAEVFGSETNSSAALSHCMAMNRSGFGFRVPQRKAN
jgi:hypothetical protein